MNVLGVILSIVLITGSLSALVISLLFSEKNRHTWLVALLATFLLIIGISLFNRCSKIVEHSINGIPFETEISNMLHC